MQEPTRNNRRLVTFLVDRLNRHSVADVRITTNTISPYQSDAAAALAIGTQHSNKSNQHDFRHEVLNLWEDRKNTLLD